MKREEEILERYLYHHFLSDEDKKYIANKGLGFMLRKNISNELFDRYSELLNRLFREQQGEFSFDDLPNYIIFGNNDDLEGNPFYPELPDFYVEAYCISNSKGEKKYVYDMPYEEIEEKLLSLGYKFIRNTNKDFDWDIPMRTHSIIGGIYFKEN